MQTTYRFHCSYELIQMKREGRETVKRLNKETENFPLSKRPKELFPCQQARSRLLIRQNIEKRLWEIWIFFFSRLSKK